MKKSYYKLFLEIFTEIFESETDLDEEELKKKFGEKEYKMFDKYFVHIQDYYVKRNELRGDRYAVSLTDRGLEFYLKLKQDYDNQKNSRLTLQASLGAVLLALGAFLMDKLPPLANATLVPHIAYWFSVGIILSVGGAFIWIAAMNFISMRD